MTGENPGKNAPRPDGAAVPTDPAEIAYVRGLVERGEAVKVAPGEPLPPGATHEIVGETPEGVPIVKRRRFSAY